MMLNLSKQIILLSKFKNNNFAVNQREKNEMNEKNREKFLKISSASVQKTIDLISKHEITV